NGPNDIATFGLSNQTDILLSGVPTEVNELVFNPGLRGLQSRGVASRNQTQRLRHRVRRCSMNYHHRLPPPPTPSLRTEASQCARNARQRAWRFLSNSLQPDHTVPCFSRTQYHL